MMPEQKTAAIRYWEKRRVIFNALLLIDACIGWNISNAFNAGIDDIPGARITDAGVLWQFAMIFFALNFAFCIGYVAEYFCMANPPRKFWPGHFRSLLLAAICLISMWAMGGRAGKIAKEAAYTKAGVLGFGAEKHP